MAPIETWECHICKSERLDKFISVFKTDISNQYNLPQGSIFQNVRYCNDRPECKEGARTFSFFDKDNKVKI